MDVEHDDADPEEVVVVRAADERDRDDVMRVPVCCVERGERYRRVRERERERDVVRGAVRT